MSKPYKFVYVTGLMNWVGSKPSNHIFTVHIKFTLSFNPVITEPLYVAQSYQDAFDYLETVANITPNTKKRQLFVKQFGVRHKHFYYDENFAEALEVEDVDGDEYYEEPTADDRASVRLDHRKKIVVAKWRGADRRSEGKRVVEDEIPF